MTRLILGFALMVGAVAIHLVGGLAVILHLRRRVAARLETPPCSRCRFWSSSSRCCCCST